MNKSYYTQIQQKINDRTYRIDLKDAAALANIYSTYKQGRIGPMA